MTKKDYILLSRLIRDARANHSDTCKAGVIESSALGQAVKQMRD